MDRPWRGGILVTCLVISGVGAQVFSADAVGLLRDVGADARLCSVCAASTQGLEGGAAPLPTRGGGEETSGWEARRLAVAA